MVDRADNPPDAGRIKRLDVASSRFLVSTRNIVPENSSGFDPLEDLHLATQDQNRPAWLGIGGINSFTGPSERLMDWDECNSVFTKQMLRTLRGYPRSDPDPCTHIPSERSGKGFLIGDLAILRGPAPNTGYLATFFNIFLPADHPVNKGKVPDDFTPFPLSPDCFIKKRAFHEDAYIASPSVRTLRKEVTPEGSTVEFEANGSDGAIFGLPCGLTSEDLEGMPDLQQYIADNIFSWYAFCVKRIPLFNGDLRIIIGIDKATAWTHTFFLGTGVTNKGDFHAKCTTERTTDGVKWHYESFGTNYRMSAGPDPQDLRSLRDQNDTSSEYCCKYTLFVRTLNPMLSDRYWSALGKSDKEGKKKPPSEAFMGIHRICIALTSRLPLSVAHWADRARTVIRRIHPPQGPQIYLNSRLQTDETQVEHPSNNLNKQILEKMPWAKMVITDDHDWLHSVRDDDDFSTDMLESLAARILSTKSVRHRHGILVLS